MLRLTLAALVALAALWVTQPAAATAIVTHQITTIPLAMVVPVTLCTGEDVLVEGQLQIGTHTVEDESGGIHVGIVLNSRKLVVTGLTSGVTYHGTDGAHSAFSAASPPQNELTEAFELNLASSGEGGNLVVQTVFHETVDANGNVQAQVEVGARDVVGELTTAIRA